MKKCIVAAAFLLVAGAASANLIIDDYDGTLSYAPFRSVSWTDPDTMTNNTGDTRGGQLRGRLAATLNFSSLGFTDALGSSVEMEITLTENIGNELPGIGQVMLADGDDRRWLFYFDDFTTGSALGSPAASATTLTITSNATSGRDTGQGTNDGSDFDWSRVGNPGGDSYWIQVFNKQVGGGAHPINLTFGQMSIVPEPGTLGLVGMFGGLLLFFRRRTAA